MALHHNPGRVQLLDVLFASFPLTGDHHELFEEKLPASELLGLGLLQLIQPGLQLVHILRLR